MHTFLLFFLSGLSFVAAGSIASRFYREVRSECAMVWGLAWFTLTILPIHVLGWANLLTRVNLGLGSLVLSLAVLAVCLPASKAREGLGEVLQCARWIGRGALEVVEESRRSFVIVGLVAVVLLLAWSTLLTYLAASTSWDGLLYHEPMVAYPIQNEGFSLTNNHLSSPAMGCIDGFPRIAENFGIWIGIWAGRSMLEIPGTLVSPIVLLACYAMIRRYTSSRSLAAGFACAIWLMPGCVLLLRSTYIDVVFFAAVAPAIHFCTREKLRGRDVLVASVALGLVGGMKLLGLVLVPLLALILIVRFVAGAVAERAPRKLWILLLGAVLCAALAAPSYVRNWVEFGNPIFPGVLSIPALGIEWEGVIDAANMNRSAEAVIRELFAPPNVGTQYHDTRDNGYGNGHPFVLLPIGVIGMLFAIAVSILPKMGRWDRALARNLVLTTLPMALTLIVSPERSFARYNLHVVLAVTLGAVWLLSELRRGVVAHGLVAILIVTSLITFHWSDPGWDAPLERVVRLLEAPPIRRPEISSEGPATPAIEVVRARERELAAGDLVVFTHVTFPGNLWNLDMSNRVQFVGRMGSPDDWIDHVEELGAQWAVVDRELIRALRGDPSWRELGALDDNAMVFVYRSPAVP